MTNEEAYLLVHNNLASMPLPWCKWKITEQDGSVTTKTVRANILTFQFVNDPELKNNLAELRFVLDYHHSLYNLHQPGLTFGWHHRLVILQIIAAICEGFLFDACCKKFEQDQHTKILWNEKKSQSNVGMGYLCGKAQQLNLYDAQTYQWLQHLQFARNTIHPRSLNHEKARWDSNPLLTAPLDQIVERLDDFIALNEAL